MPFIYRTLRGNERPLVFILPLYDRHGYLFCLTNCTLPTLMLAVLCTIEEGRKQRNINSQSRTGEFLQQYFCSSTRTSLHSRMDTDNRIIFKSPHFRQNKTIHFFFYVLLIRNFCFITERHFCFFIFKCKECIVLSSEIPLCHLHFSAMQWKQFTVLSAFVSLPSRCSLAHNKR